MRRAGVLLVLATALFLACGDDDGNGTGPDAANVAGTWTYTTTLNINVAGVTISCDITGLSITLNQSGSSFTGSYSGTATATCQPVNPGVSPTPTGGQVVNGSVTSGGAVQFDFDDPNWRHTGTVSGNTMSGSVTVNAQGLTLNGTFSATR